MPVRSSPGHRSLRSQTGDSGFKPDFDGLDKLLKTVRQRKRKGKGDAEARIPIIAGPANGIKGGGKGQPESPAGQQGPAQVDDHGQREQLPLAVEDQPEEHVEGSALESEYQDSESVQYAQVRDYIEDFEEDVDMVDSLRGRKRCGSLVLDSQAETGTEIGSTATRTVGSAFDDESGEYAAICRQLFTGSKNRRVFSSPPSEAEDQAQYNEQDQSDWEDISMQIRSPNPEDGLALDTQDQYNAMDSQFSAGLEGECHRPPPQDVYGDHDDSSASEVEEEEAYFELGSSPPLPSSKPSSPAMSSQASSSSPTLPPRSRTQSQNRFSKKPLPENPFSSSPVRNPVFYKLGKTMLPVKGFEYIARDGMIHSSIVGKGLFGNSSKKSRNTTPQRNGTPQPESSRSERASSVASNGTDISLGSTAGSVLSGAKYTRESDFKNLPLGSVYKAVRLDLEWYTLFESPFATDAELLAQGRLPWNELAEDAAVSDQFLMGTAIFALMKKRVNGVRSQLFLQGRSWFVNYFGFERMEPAQRIEWCAALLQDNAYAAHLDDVGNPQVKGRFASICRSLFVPFIYNYWFRSPSCLGHRTTERFLGAISPQFLCFILVAAHNTILQYQTGSFKSGRGFGDMLGRAKTLYTQHHNTFVSTMKSGNSEILLAAISAGVRQKMVAEHDYTPPIRVLNNIESLEDGAIRKLLMNQVCSIEKEWNDMQRDKRANVKELNSTYQAKSRHQSAVSFSQTPRPSSKSRAQLPTSTAKTEKRKQKDGKAKEVQSGAERISSKTSVTTGTAIEGPSPEPFTMVISPTPSSESRARGSTSAGEKGMRKEKQMKVPAVVRGTSPTRAKGKLLPRPVTPCSSSTQPSLSATRPLEKRKHSSEEVPTTPKRRALTSREPATSSRVPTILDMFKKQEASVVNRAGSSSSSAQPSKAVVFQKVLSKSSRAGSSKGKGRAVE